MIELPRGWTWSTVGEVGRLQLGRQRAPRYHSGPHMRPYLRVANIFEDRIDIRDVKEMNFEPMEFERYRLRDGDILLNEGQTPELLGRPAIYRGNPTDVGFTNSLIRFQANLDIDPRWALTVFRHHMHSGRFTRESRITTNIAHLSIGRLRGVEFPVPPIDEQRRIVDILEDHLSRLDAAEAALNSASRRAMLLTLTSGMQAITGVGLMNASRSVSFGDREVVLPRGWKASTVGDEALLVQYGTSSKTSEAVDVDAIAVLRMGNLQGGTIVTDKLKYLPRNNPDVASLLLERGDLLFNRTNSAELVGKSAIFDRDDYSMTFASYLIRVRFGPTVRPAWANLVMNSPLGRAYVGSVASQQVGQANVNGTKLKAFPLLVPPLDVQDQLLARHEAVHVTGTRLVAEVARARQRTSLLRRTLLRAAFTGQLTGRSSDLDRAEESIA